MKKNSIVVIDFGSQYNQLIARRIREAGVYVEIISCFESLEFILRNKPNGIILSGGPSSVYSDGSPTINKEIYNTGIPILGICYGMQLTSQLLGGKVEKASKQEFGKSEIIINTIDNLLYKNIPKKHNVWMSHGDHVSILPEGFESIANTESCIAAISNPQKKIYGIQYHPEVTHSEYGNILLENFVFEIAKCTKNWSMKNYIHDAIQNIKKIVGSKKVILGLSGGVDSSVAAVLIHRAIGKQLICIFVDNGLLRKNEVDDVMKTYSNFDMNVICISANDRFLHKLEGISDPESKRKIIGKEFVDIFQEYSEQVDFLAQGTIYPDVIESQSVKGPSAVIKSHHNVGGLPEDMKLQLLEPLRELFKDEVRSVGRELGMSEITINRHPFPGPGLGIRILGEVSKEKINILKEADNIFIEELRSANLYNQVSQAFVVLLPVKSVGVMGDERTYEYTAAIRSVNTIDFMTATWSRLPYELLDKVSNRIINEVKGINRVVYDISSKPPATIERE